MVPPESAASPEHLCRHGRALRSLAARLLDDPATADDVVQEAVTAAWQRQVPAEHAGRWLAGVTRRLALLARRRDARRRRREALAARAEADGDDTDVAATSEIARQVTALVDALDEPFRTAIVLRFWHGLPPRAIAKRTGVPVATARSRIRRGLERLRGRLGEAHGNRQRWATALAGLAAPPLPLASTFLGLLWMGTTAKLAAVAVATATVAWLLWPSAAPPRAEAGSVVGSPPAADTTAAAVRADRSDPPAAAPRRSAVGEAPAAVPALVVVGRLIDEANGLPIVGGEVGLLPPGTGAPAVRTGTDGGFRIAIEQANEAPVLAVLTEAPGYAVERETFRTADAEGTPPTIDLGTLAKAPGTALSGFVRDASGRPLADTRVFLATGVHFVGGLHLTGALSELLPIATTGPDGWFRAASRLVPVANETLVVAGHTDGVGWTIAELTRERRELEITIEIAGAPLTVSVLDAAGSPIEGARVTALPRFHPLGHAAIAGADELGSDPRIAGVFAARTDPSGTVHLAGLPLGDGADWGPRGGYRLRIEADGFRTDVRDIDVPPEGRTITATLMSAGAVALTVQVLAADAPVPGAEVVVAGRTGRTDAAGQVTWTLVDAQGPELHYVVKRDGFVPIRGTWPTPEAGSASRTVTIEPATTFAGRVVDQHGEPVEGARIFVAGSRQGTTDADGRFAIPDLPRTPLGVTVMPPTPESDWAGVYGEEARPIDEQPTRYVLTRLAAGICTLTFDVVGMADGAPVSPESAALQPIDARDVPAGGSMKPDEARIGRLRFEAVRPGRHQLTLSGGRVSRIVTIADGQRTAHERVEVGAPGSIDGELLLGDAAGTTWPERVQIQIGPDSNAARWTPPAAGELLTHEPHGIVWAAELSPAVDARFRLENADPHRQLSVTASGGGLIGRAAFRVPPGGTATPRVVLVPAGRVTLRFAAPSPWHRLQLHLESDDDRAPPPPPHELTWLQGATQHPLAVAAGNWRWRITTTDLSTGAPVEIARGTCDVPAGGSAELEVPVPAAPDTGR